MILLLATSFLSQNWQADLKTIKPDNQSDIWYLDGTATPDDIDLPSVLRFVIGSSTSQQVVERFTPVDIGGGWWRIDLSQLKWDVAEFKRELAEYPYGQLAVVDVHRKVQIGDTVVIKSTARPLKPSTTERVNIPAGTKCTVSGTVERDGKLWLEVIHDGQKAMMVDGWQFADAIPSVLPIVRADWLIMRLIDETDSDLRPRLLYGDGQATLQDVKKFWKVVNDDPVGVIETDSKVANSKVRLLENYPAANRGGFYWGTRDSAKIDRDTDPLEHPNNKFRFTAGEHVFAMPKISIRSYQRGVLLDWMLALADGTRQAKATADLVNDSNRTRNTADINNPVACYVCHPKGLNLPSGNGLRDLLERGARLFDPDAADAERIELFHLGGVKPLMESHNTLYATGVKMVNGLSPEENAEAIKVFVTWYDSPVSVEQAARELRVETDDLPMMLGYANKEGIDIKARGVALAHGQAIPRTSFESIYLNLLAAVEFARAAGIPKVEP